MSLRRLPRFARNDRRKKARNDNQVFFHTKLDKRYKEE